MYKHTHENLIDGPVELTVKVNSSEFLIKQGSVTLNSNIITNLPYSEGSLFIRQVSDFFIAVSGPDFLIMFDGLRVYVTLENEFIGNTRGLCGTYNFRDDDEFLPPRGFPETEASNFAEAYQVEESGEEESGSCTIPSGIIRPCDINILNEPQANKFCSILKTHEVFTKVASVLDSAPYFEACRSDLCIDSSELHTNFYVCRAFAHYAYELAARGQIIDWFNHPDLAEIKKSCEDTRYGKCSGGSKYTESSSLVGKSCADFGLQDKVANHLSQQIRHCPGCSCPDNKYFDDTNYGMCVDKQSCPCYDPATRKSKALGYKLKKGCSSCVCDAGEWKCDNVSCKDVIKCSSNQVFSKTAPSLRRTCANKDHLRASSQTVEGCTCPEDLIWDTISNQCIPETECPCKHGGKIYNHTEIVKVGCDSCECRGGNWLCTKNKCDGICVAAGDPHYTTFDGKRFSYQGNCKYTLAQTNDQKFRVIVENVPCGTTGVTCAKNIQIKYNDLQIDLIREKNPEVNNNEIKNLDQGAKVYGDVQIMRAGLYVIIKTNNFLIKWDEGTRLYVVVHNQWSGIMQGICGNFDMDSSNDLTTVDGIETTEKDFVESWQVESSCPKHVSPLIDESDPCRNHTHRRAWATSQCSLIEIPGQDNPFTPCLERIDEAFRKRSYLECLFDACSCDSGGDCECLCTALSAFAEQCIKIGVPVKWRTQHRCPIQCEYGKEYQACGSLCSQTCMDLSTGNNPSCPEEACIEGCFCPEGFVQDYDGKCIRADNCDCYLEQTRYPPGSEVTKDCQLLVCTNGTFQAVQNLTDCQQACNPQTEFTCMADKTCLPIRWKCVRFRFLYFLYSNI